MRYADCLLRGIEGGDVRDADAGRVSRLEPQRFDALFDPGPSPVNDDEVDPQAAHQREVVDDAVKLRVRGRLAIDLDDEGAAAMGVDVGSRAAEPVDEAHRHVHRTRVVHLGTS